MTSPATVCPSVRNATPAATSVSAPATAMRRSPYRSAACPAGRASSNGAMAKLAPSTPSHAGGTSSSIARYDIVGRSTNVTTCVVTAWASSTPSARRRCHGSDIGQPFPLRYPAKHVYDHIGPYFVQDGALSLIAPEAVARRAAPGNGPACNRVVSPEKVSRIS